MNCINLVVWKSFESTTSAAQTNGLLLAAGPRELIEVAVLRVSLSKSTVVSPQIRIGFAAASLPAESLVAVPGLVYSHTGHPAGESFPGQPGRGLPGQSLLMTSQVPTGGAIVVNYMARVIQVN